MEGNHTCRPPVSEAGKDRDAREIITKWALWDAGFCGEESAERGPIMLAAYDLVERAHAEGRLLERQSLLDSGWTATVLEEMKVDVNRLTYELDKSRARHVARISDLEAELEGARIDLRALNFLWNLDDRKDLGSSVSELIKERDKYREALENIATQEKWTIVEEERPAFRICSELALAALTPRAGGTG